MAFTYLLIQHPAPRNGVDAGARRPDVTELGEEVMTRGIPARRKGMCRGPAAGRSRHVKEVVWRKPSVTGAGGKDTAHRNPGSAVQAMARAQALLCRWEAESRRAAAVTSCPCARMAASMPKPGPLSQLPRHWTTVHEPG